MSKLDNLKSLSEGFLHFCMYVFFPVYFLFTFMVTYLTYSIKHDFYWTTDFGFILSLIGFIALIIKLNYNQK